MGFILYKSVHRITSHGVSRCLLQTEAWQSPNSVALTLVDVEGWNIQRS